MKQDKIDKMLQLIKNDKAQENHLFKTLATTENPFPLLKPFKNAGYFNPDKNPSPVEVENQKGYFTIPHWNVLDYLENTARRNKQAPREEITDTLLDIIQPIIDFRTERKERIDNYRTDWVLTKIIFLLPLDRIKAKHFEFIRTALNSRWDTTLIASEIGKSIIPALLKESSKELLIKLFEIILDYKVIENNSTDKYLSIVDKYWLNSAFKQHKGSIAKLCGKEIAELTLTIITRIIEEDKSQFNNVWIPTIEDHPQTSFPDRYECQLVYLVRDIYQESNPTEIYEKIKELLNQEPPIFNRMALHLINYHYSNLNQLFWEWKDNPLNTPLVKHELYELLKKNCNSFRSDQINKILKWIEEKEYFVSDEQKDDTKLIEKILAYRKKEWLSALLDRKDKKIIDLYNKYNEVNPAELEHPGFDFWSESGWGTVSPIEETDFLTKSNEDIADYLISFKEKAGWKEPTVDGLAGTLMKCVSDNPHKFTDNIKPFLRVQRVYQHSLLLGFSDAWRANKDFEWKSLFLFINKILESKTFWTEEYPNKGYHYRNWIISQIVDLINDGTQRDEHAFDPVYLPDAEKILLLLVNNAESNFYEIHDIVTSVLNSVKGKIFTAMVNYSLRYARLNRKDGGNRWIQTIKIDFTERLNKETEDSLDFYVVLGEFLPNLYYLDKEWVINNIDKIFPKENETYWQAAFTGYLFYSSTVYTHLYKLLSQNGHYKKALNINFDDDHITERVAQHICVAYLEDWEKLGDNNSLISQLINNNDTKQLSAIISFFWMQRDHATDRIKNKIKPLWKCLFTCFKTNQDKDDFQKLISDISKWLVLVDTIDENVFEWLKLSVKYIERNFSSPFFIEYLLIHAEKSPKKVAYLFIKMLNQGFYPDYKKEAIEKIIRILNSQNQKENAIKVCNLYLNKGFEFVRPILEEIR